MAIQPVQYRWSKLRKGRVEVSRLYEDGFLFLEGDPGVWIQSNPGGLLSSVRSLELDLWRYKDDDRIGDSIGELSQLTHLCIREGLSLKWLSQLQNLHHLELRCCRELQELPANLGDLDSLTSLTLDRCRLLKSLSDSVAKLSKLTTLSISDCDVLQELPAELGGCHNLTTFSISYCHQLQILPANLGDVELLTTLFLDSCNKLRCLPWSVAKLSKLRFLYLPKGFRLETLPPHMNDSVIISVVETHVRKTWKELKTEIQFPIIPEEAALAPGYLRLQGDPMPWIRVNYGLLSSVRVLDLEFGYGESQNNIPDSIGKLSQLTHLYITHGCLHRLPLPFRIVHLSLFDCTFVCDIESHFDSLGSLSNLVSLHLLTDCNGLPEHMDFPISLRRLTLACFGSLSDSMPKLNNLETLNLYSCQISEPFPLHSKFNKLILRCSHINSVPIGLKHLEIIHDTDWCFEEPCDELPECLNQGVNLETLSFTCYTIKSFSIVTSLHNLRELRLKDCFSLKKLPQNLDAMEDLCSLNVSGTRIKSLPNSVTKLHNLRHLILPKCFNLKSLPCDFENKVKISVDDTHESYYKHEGYYNSYFGTSDEEDSSISDSERLDEVDPIISDPIGGFNEIVLEESRQDAIIESGSSCRPLNHHVPDDSQIVEGSHFPGRKDPISNNNYHAFSSSPNHETEFLPTENEDGIISSVNDCHLHFQENTRQVHAPMEIDGNNSVSENNSHATFSIQNQEIQIETSHSRDRDDLVTSVNSIDAEPSSNIQETNLCAENSQEAFQNGRMDNVNLEWEQEIAPCDSLNPVHGDNSQSDNVKHNTQKKEIPLERIREVMSQNITLKYAAEELLHVSRSTLKRALKTHNLTWPSTRKRKNPDKNRNETHDGNSSFGRNLSQLNLVDPSNPAGVGQGTRHFDRPNQNTMSVHVPSDPNFVDESNSDAGIRTVEEPPMSTQCLIDGHQRVEEHVNSAKERALANADAHPNESCSTFDVKATYNQETVRFYFSLSSSFEQLKEELGKRFELEVRKFKMYYQDDEKDWILLTCISDLERALHFSKLSGSNVVRLSIKLSN